MPPNLPATDAARLRVLMVSTLPHGMTEHIDRVVVLAGALARRHGLDERRTLLAAQAHDLLRAVPEPALLADAEARGLDLEDVEREHPVLLHGPLAALALAERGWVTDALVLDAVRYHTTGHPEYSREAWAMFIADKVEPHKLERWPALQAVVELADDSLEAAALAYLELRRTQGSREGQAEHPLAQATRKALHRRAALG
jgi:predicted HD superfamily hydrolase involved in NAD metabolism